MRAADHGEESIDLHWDKDEDLVDAQGINVHPQISTVTYLSDWGGPTLVLEKTTPSDYYSKSGVCGSIKRVGAPDNATLFQSPCTYPS